MNYTSTKEFFAAASRHIEKGPIALIFAEDQVENILKEDFTFTEEEYNTYSCPWHHNLTAAIVSFRTAKALRYNPGSKHDIEAFHWHNSIPFA